MNRRSLIKSLESLKEAAENHRVPDEELANELSSVADQWAETVEGRNTAELMNRLTELCI
jgi:hypothetical protein